MPHRCFHLLPFRSYGLHVCVIQRKYAHRYDHIVIVLNWESNVREETGRYARYASISKSIHRIYRHALQDLVERNLNKPMLIPARAADAL